MNIRDIIMELADQPYRYYQIRRTPTQDEYQFQTANGGVYRVLIEKEWQIPSDAGDQPLKIVGPLLQPEGSQFEEVFVGFSYMDPKNDRETVSITGTGDAYRVFATVRDIMMRYVQGRPRYISFSGKSSEPSRVDLYKRIANTAQRWLPGYRKSKEEQDDDQAYFRLERVDATQPVNELKWDNEQGLGQTPNNQNIDYMGMRVQMRPSVFLKLAAPIEMRPKDRETIEFMKSTDQAFGSPTLYITVPDEWRDGDFSQGQAQVSGHEGRHRMVAQGESEGDRPVETHIILKSPYREWRNRHITPELIDRLNQAINSERGIPRRGPFFRV